MKTLKPTRDDWFWLIAFALDQVLQQPVEPRSIAEWLRPPEPRLNRCWCCRDLTKNLEVCDACAGNKHVGFETFDAATPRQILRLR